MSRHLLVALLGGRRGEEHPIASAVGAPPAVRERAQELAAAARAEAVAQHDPKGWWPGLFADTVTAHHKRWRAEEAPDVAALALELACRESQPP